MWKQKASAFSNSVVVENLVTFSEKVEAEKSRNNEPQPLVTQYTMPNPLPLRRRLRLRKVETKNLSLQ